MRNVRFSRTFFEQFAELLDFGEQQFGEQVVEEKRKRVLKTIQLFLAEHPEMSRPDPLHGLRTYPVHRTPFVIIYDFDDIELRVQFIMHKSADLTDIDAQNVRW